MSCLAGFESTAGVVDTKIADLLLLHFTGVEAKQPSKETRMAGICSVVLGFIVAQSAVEAYTWNQSY